MNPSGQSFERYHPSYKRGKSLHLLLAKQKQSIDNYGTVRKKATKTTLKPNMLGYRFISDPTHLWNILVFDFYVEEMILWSLLVLIRCLTPKDRDEKLVIKNFQKDCVLKYALGPSKKRSRTWIVDVQNIRPVTNQCFSCITSKDGRQVTYGDNSKRKIVNAT